MYNGLLRSLVPLLLAILAVCATERAALGQGATARLYGDWEYDGGDMEILFRFEEKGNAVMSFDGKGFATPAASGEYKVVSESRDEKSRAVVKIDLVWGNNAEMTHKLIITYLKDDRIEMAFNKEQLRY